MKLRYLLSLFLINNCSGCNNNNENGKTEKPTPKPIKPINNIYDNIISDIKSYVENKKPLPNDIKSEINELIQEKDISDNQKKTLNNIKNNLNNKDELKKIINDLKNKNSVIIGTYRADGKYLSTSKNKVLSLFNIAESNNISKEEILDNITVFINDRVINKDKLEENDFFILLQVR